MIINGQDKYAQSLVHLKYNFVLISSICKYFTHFVIKLPHFVKPTMLSDNASLILQ